MRSVLQAMVITVVEADPTEAAFGLLTFVCAEWTYRTNVGDV